MFSLQEYQHVHLLWFKKRSFTLVWKPNPPLCSVRCAYLRAHADAPSESTMGAHCSRSAYAPLLRCLCSALCVRCETRLYWSARTWSVKSFSCYNVLRLAARALWSSADHALAQVRPCQIFTCTLSKNGRSLEPCGINLSTVRNIWTITVTCSLDVAVLRSHKNLLFVFLSIASDFKLLKCNQQQKRTNFAICAHCLRDCFWALFREACACEDGANRVREHFYCCCFTGLEQLNTHLYVSKYPSLQVSS